MLKFDDRFARQDRCEPPPEFPLASPCSSIVHHLSGLSTRALAPRPLASSRPRAGVAPARSRAGSRPFCLSCATGVRRSPSTRARAQLLGPCFKTGRTECREPRDPDPGCGATPDDATSGARDGKLRAVCRRRPRARRLESLPRVRGVHRRRSSPARPARTPAACNTARVRARLPCRRASDGRADGRRAPPPPSAPPRERDG